MFGLFKNKKLTAEITELTEWLSHPNEFGVEPKSVKHLKSYNVELMSYGKTNIHLFEYQMPDGTKGRGFVNPTTWSFMGENVNLIPDDLLLFAYAGWLFLFPAIQNGSALTAFESDGEEARYLNQLKENGLKEITITGRYKIGTSELFEFKAEYNGEEVHGAGNTQSEIGCNSSDPKFHLPAIYFLLGNQVLPH